MMNKKGDSVYVHACDYWIHQNIRQKGLFVYYTMKPLFYSISIAATANLCVLNVTKKYFWLFATRIQPLDNDFPKQARG